MGAYRVGADVVKFGRGQTDHEVINLSGHHLPAHGTVLRTDGRQLGPYHRLHSLPECDHGSERVAESEPTGYAGRIAPRFIRSFDADPPRGAAQARRHPDRIVAHPEVGPVIGRYRKQCPSTTQTLRDPLVTIARKPTPTSACARWSCPARSDLFRVGGASVPAPVVAPHHQGGLHQHRPRSTPQLIRDEKAVEILNRAGESLPDARAFGVVTSFQQSGDCVERGPQVVIVHAPSLKPIKTPKCEPAGR